MERRYARPSEPGCRGLPESAARCARALAGGACCAVEGRGVLTPPVPLGRDCQRPSRCGILGRAETAPRLRWRRFIGATVVERGGCRCRTTSPAGTCRTGGRGRIRRVVPRRCPDYRKGPCRVTPVLRDRTRPWWRPYSRMNDGDGPDLLGCARRRTGSSICCPAHSPGRCGAAGAGLFRVEEGTVEILRFRNLRHWRVPETETRSAGRGGRRPERLLQPFPVGPDETEAE